MVVSFHHDDEYHIIYHITLIDIVTRGMNYVLLGAILVVTHVNLGVVAGYTLTFSLKENCDTTS
jgi:hypothetical protein